MLIYILLILTIFGANATLVEIGISLIAYDLLCLAILRLNYKLERQGPIVLILGEIVFSMALSIVLMIG